MRVNIKAVKKQLQREIRANPGKAGVLGLLLAYALWAWAPLVGGWFSGDEKPKAAIVPPVAKSDTPAPGESAAEPQKEDAFEQWRSIAEAIDNDPLMRPTTRFSGGRDPLAEHAQRGMPIVEQEEPERPVVVAQPRPREPEMTPKRAGLTLTSTVIGPRRSVAVVNGKAYILGREIHGFADGKPISFRLIDVQARRVILQRKGKQYALKMRPPLASVAEVEVPAAGWDGSGESVDN